MTPEQEAHAKVLLAAMDRIAGPTRDALWDAWKAHLEAVEQAYAAVHPEGIEGVSRDAGGRHLLRHDIVSGLMPTTGGDLSSVGHTWIQQVVATPSQAQQLAEASATEIAQLLGLKDPRMGKVAKA